MKRHIRVITLKDRNSMSTIATGIHLECCTIDEREAIIAATRVELHIIREELEPGERTYNAWHGDSPYKSFEEINEAERVRWRRAEAAR